MSRLFLFRLVFDFGLVVLIWMVQLIIYPSFLYYPKEDLLVWHAEYTKAISYVVIPLMIGQLVVGILQIARKRSLYSVSSILAILAVWVSTFLIFVPLHQSIGTDDFTAETLQQLVNKNWVRTSLWSILFLLNFLFIKLKMK